MRVAYLTNQYPKVSHTFIRREILEMERQSVDVERFAFRGWDAEVVDPVDLDEQTKTHYTLRDGIVKLVWEAVKYAFKNPRPFWAALKMSVFSSKKSYRPLPYHLIYLAHACWIAQTLERNPVAHIHAHFGTNSAEVALLVHILTAIPYSFTVHGMDEADNAKKLGFDQKIRNAQFVVSVSAYTRSQIMRHIDPELWSKLKVVHCGLDEASFESAPSGNPSSNPTFLTIGRFSPEKGHLVLLPAFKALLSKHENARLVLIGDGDMRVQIEENVRKLGLEEAVRFTGWVGSGDVLKELRACDILVQPSFIEGLPVVIMEAMAQARPVISTYVAGIPELVQDGVTGKLVPAGDVEALTASMVSILQMSPDALRTMGTIGYARVKERHSIGTEVAKLRALMLESSE